MPRRKRLDAALARSAARIAANSLRVIICWQSCVNEIDAGNSSASQSHSVEQSGETAVGANTVEARIDSQRRQFIRPEGICFVQRFERLVDLTESHIDQSGIEGRNVALIRQRLQRREN